MEKVLCLRLFLLSIPNHEGWMPYYTSGHATGSNADITRRPCCLQVFRVLFVQSGEHDLIADRGENIGCLGSTARMIRSGRAMAGMRSVCCNSLCRCSVAVLSSQVRVLDVKLHKQGRGVASVGGPCSNPKSLILLAPCFSQLSTVGSLAW